MVRKDKRGDSDTRAFSLEYASLPSQETAVHVVPGQALSLVVSGSKHDSMDEPVESSASRDQEAFRKGFVALCC